MHIGGCKGVSCDTGRGLLDLTTSWTESEGPREAQRPSTVSKRSPPLVCLLFFMIHDSGFRIPVCWSCNLHAPEDRLIMG